MPLRLKPSLLLPSLALDGHPLIPAGTGAQLGDWDRGIDHTSRAHAWPTERWETLRAAVFSSDRAVLDQVSSDVAQNIAYPFAAVCMDQSGHQMSVDHYNLCSVGVVSANGYLKSSGSA